MVSYKQTLTVIINIIDEIYNTVKYGIIVCARILLWWQIEVCMCGYNQTWTK